MRRNPESIVHRKADKGHISFRRDRMQVDQAEAASRTVGRVRKNSIRAKDADRLARADLADPHLDLHTVPLSTHLASVRIVVPVERVWLATEPTSPDELQDDDLDNVYPDEGLDPTRVYTLYDRNDPVLGLPEIGFSYVSPDDGFSVLSRRIRMEEGL